MSYKNGLISILHDQAVFLLRVCQGFLGELSFFDFSPELLICLDKFCRSLLDASFQFVVRLLQSLFGLLAISDVSRYAEKDGQIGLRAFFVKEIDNSRFFLVPSFLIIS